MVIEDWIDCTCGAYQNVRRLNEITVEPTREDVARARTARMRIASLLLAVAYRYR